MAAPMLVLVMAMGCAQPAPPDEPAEASTAVDRDRLLADLEALSADGMEGRRVGTPGGERARAYVVNRFGEAGLAPAGTDEYVMPFVFQSGRGDAAVERAGVNVVGQVTGTEFPDRYIVVTAHYDHVGVRDGEIYNGADDNASGTAALFALGEYFSTSPARHSILFVAFDAEESGLRGARAFVAEPPVPVDRLAFNLNMDMIGRDPDDRLFVSGTHQQPALKPMIERVAADAPVNLLMGHDNPDEPDVEDWTRASDHYPFCEAGVPCLYIGVEDFEQHHEPTDDYETMTHDFYVRAVETMIAMVNAVDADLANRPPASSGSR